MAFRTLEDRVILRREIVDETVKNGIILTHRTPPQEGEVVAAGPDATDVADGDLVLFTKGAGTEVVLDGEKLLVIRQTDILGILEKE